jgi:type IV secretory pathway VirB10-like protein
MTAERYLQAFRRAVDVPGDSRERNLEAIERRLVARQVARQIEDDEPTRAPVEARGRWAAALVVFKAVSISVGLGVAGLGAVKVGAMAWSATVRKEAPAAHADDPEPVAAPRPRAHAQEPTVPAPESAATIEPPAIPEASASVEPRPEPTVDAASPPETRARSSRPRAKPPIADRLREEVDLLERARAQLDAGRHEAALALLGEHEQRFSDGAMIEERRAWRAIAGCSLRRTDARAEAEAFFTRHPRSALADKVRRACADRLTDPAPRSDGGM